MIKSKSKYYKDCPWIVKCLIRDGYKCTKCGTSKSLVVHHIDESRKTGNMNNNLSNLVTLCRKHHAEVHGLIMKKSNKTDRIFRLKERGLSFAEIGRKIGVTRQRVHKIYQNIKGA